MAKPETLEEYKETEKYYDKVYRRIDDCNDINESVEEELADHEKRISFTENDVKFFKTMAKIIATSGIGTMVVALLNLILK